MNCLGFLKVRTSPLRLRRGGRGNVEHRRGRNEALALLAFPLTHLLKKGGTVLLIFLSFPIHALDLEQAEQMALEADPELAALAARVRGLEAEAVAAGQLPDPMLSVGVMNVPVPDFSLNAEPMSQAQLGISQRFPARARREAQTDFKQAEAAAVHSRLALRSLNIRRDVRSLWVNIQHREAMLALEAEMAGVLDLLTETLDARLETGGVYQTAVLSTRARRARLEKRLADRRVSLLQARAALSEQLDPTPVPRELAPAELPPPHAVVIEDHPELTAVRLDVDAAQQKIAVADAGFRPGWQINVGVGRRFGTVPVGAPSDTLIAASVGIDLPLFTRNRQSRRLEAAREEFNAAATGPVEVRRRLAAQHRAARGTYAEFAELVEQYADSVLPLAREQEASAEIQYRTAQQELDPVLESQLARLEIELELAQLKLARDESAVTLMYLAGE